MRPTKGTMVAMAVGAVVIHVALFVGAVVVIAIAARWVMS